MTRSVWRWFVAMEKSRRYSCSWRIYCFLLWFVVSRMQNDYGVQLYDYMFLSFSFGGNKFAKVPSEGSCPTLELMWPAMRAMRFMVCSLHADGNTFATVERVWTTQNALRAKNKSTQKNTVASFVSTILSYVDGASTWFWKTWIPADCEQCVQVQGLASDFAPEVFKTIPPGQLPNEIHGGCVACRCGTMLLATGSGVKPQVQDVLVAVDCKHVFNNLTWDCLNFSEMY